MNQDIEVEHYTLRILHAGRYKSNHSFARYLHHRRLAKLFSVEARKREKPDIIIAGMPIHYCAFEAVKYADENYVPIVVDVRDYWPDIFLRSFPKKFEWVGRLIFRTDFRVTKFALQNATVIVSMMSHLLEWALRRYAERNQTPDDRVFFIGGDDSNGKRVEDASELFPEIRVQIDGRFVINYIGSFSHLNQPLAVIEAVKYLNAMGHKDRILLLLAGQGDYYERCVRAAKGHDNVVFLGWLNADKIAALNSISSVGIFPSGQEFAFPNKVFSYLGGGLPVLSSERGDLNRLLEKYGAGFYFDIADRTQLAQKILELSKLDQKSFQTISDNAKSLFRECLMASKIYKEYADHVESVARKWHCSREQSCGPAA